MRMAGQRVDREAHRVDRAEPGVGDEQDHVGASQRRRGRRCRRRRPAANAGRRRLRRSRCRPRRPASLAHEVGDRERRERRASRRPWAAPTAGEVRCGGHDGLGRLAGRGGEASASVTVPGSPDCTGLRTATRTPAARSARATAAVHHVLPTSVPVPVTSTRRTGRADGSPRRRATRPAGGGPGSPGPARSSVTAGNGWRARTPTGRPARRCARPTG